MSALILLSNKCNITCYWNSSNNNDSDKNSGGDSDSNSDGNNKGDSHTKIIY